MRRASAEEAAADERRYLGVDASLAGAVTMWSLWEAGIWVVIGGAFGLVWGLVCRALRMPRGAAVALAPLAVVAMALDLLLLLLLFVLPAPANFEFRTLPMLVGAAIPALLVTYLLTARDGGAVRRPLAVVVGILLTPGLIALVAGLAPRSLRYAKEFHLVESVAPRIESFVATQGRCPELSEIPELQRLDTHGMSFNCDESGFSFCIYGSFDPLGCWDSKHRTWHF